MKSTNSINAADPFNVDVLPDLANFQFELFDIPIERVRPKAVKFIEFVENMPVGKSTWVPANYMSAQTIRKHLKKSFPDCNFKLSVTRYKNTITGHTVTKLNRTWTGV